MHAGVVEHVFRERRCDPRLAENAKACVAHSSRRTAGRVLLDRGRSAEQPRPVALCAADGAVLGRARPASSPTAPRASMAIFSTSSASEPGSPAFPIFWLKPGRIWAVRSRSSRMRLCRRRPSPRWHASGGGAFVCSLGAGRRHACRHLPPLPGPDPRRHDERPALPPEVLASG